MSLCSKEHTFYSLDLIYAYDDSKFCNWNLSHFEMYSVPVHLWGAKERFWSHKAKYRFGLLCSSFWISKSNIMVLLGAELTLSKVIINLWRIYCVTFQAYAMNGDQLLGGKTARSYASMMDKARYLQKDIEVEIR